MRRFVLMVLVFALACPLVRAAPPQLNIPHGHLGQSAAGMGPSAVSRGEAGASFIIQTRFDLANATGTVQRLSIVIGPDGLPRIGETLAWDAAVLLGGDARKPPAPAGELRNIFTLGEQATAPFRWGSLPAALREHLDAPAGSGLGEARTDFLRGDRSKEQGAGGPLRQRAGLLGDIGHSTPLVVGPPSSAGHGAGHAFFMEQHKARRTAVYVGANDGMLHAFAADDGTELFAYVPGALGMDLAALTTPGYQARSFVDGSAGHADALIEGRWRSVLVAGMGMGARGAFALDISDPAQFSKGLGALWEFTDADDPAVGHVRAPPLVAKLKAGKGKKAVARYAAVLSSGINSLAPDGNGALFLLPLDKPPGQPWEEGKNYTRIATTGSDDTLANALSAPALALRQDGSTAYAYAGDLQGGLWRFDLSANTAQRLFTARDRAGSTQPIAHAPKVLFAPGGGYLIVFGTGKLLEADDLLKPSFQPQSLYAIHDRLERVPAPIRSRAQLGERILSGKGPYTIKGEAIDFFDPEARRGWFFDFPNARNDGERAAGSPVSFAGAILFETYLPAAGPGLPASSRLYLLDALSGFAINAEGMASEDAPTGHISLASSPMPMLLVASNVSADGRTATGGATAVRSITLLKPGAGSQAVQIKVRFPAKRLGWREVANWQELHEAARKK